jgi:acetyltransferase-like isoleucine patch superfamily enzyme
MKTGFDFYINEDVVIKQKDTAIFGNHVAIDKGFYCTTEIIVGDYVHISPYCTVIGGKNGKFHMQHFTGLSAGCRIICCGDDYTSGHLMNPMVPAKYRKVKNSKVIMERFSCLGSNCVVLPGVTISEGSVVGANSLVTKTTKPWTVYVGSPAREIKKRPRELSYKFASELGYYV